ncbi:MAG: alpha-galactosidase, partial [Clostridia bacterium]|nr:alpha-galactosidase [Clostridia bacterium]
MKIGFGPLEFEVDGEGRTALTRVFESVFPGDPAKPLKADFSSFDLAGGASGGIGGYGLNYSSETSKLRYAGHRIEGDTLSLVLSGEKVEITTFFDVFPGTDAFRVRRSYKNVSADDVRLESAPTFGFKFADRALADCREMFFHRFSNTRYSECLPVVESFHRLGLFNANTTFHLENCGNASARENVPQCILEDRKNGGFLMVQVESMGGWFFEISSSGNSFILQTGGSCALYNAWSRTLAPGEVYETVPVAVSNGKTLNEVLSQMTLYRRAIRTFCEADRKLPVIFNEYMHLSWDSPFASRTAALAPCIASLGCECYVIDCGWHDPPSADTTVGMYRLFGTWFEDRERFPDGIKSVSDLMHSLGMKFGLWIAPEVVGSENKKMLEYYGDECFIHRGGVKLSNGTGYLLDFSHPKVVDYMTRTIDRMVTEYGCDYIKFDGCPNPRFGPDSEVCAGEAMERSNDAFFAWAKSMTERHPNVIFEDCFGGGERMDYRMLSSFSLISTSDQTRADRYFYISANALACVLPEQAAVWSYPVESGFLKEDPDSAVSPERVVFNMVNALIGRIHLASRLDLLGKEKLDLVREGIELYKKLVSEKLKALPYLPRGYADFGDSFAASGLKTDGKVYLFVWKLGGGDEVLDLPEITPLGARVIYPEKLP